MRIKKRYRVFFLFILLSLAFAITLGWTPYDPLAGIQVVAATYGEKTIGFPSVNTGLRRSLALR
jgi:hypothetical protein